MAAPLQALGGESRVVCDVERGLVSNVEGRVEIEEFADRGWREGVGTVGQEVIEDGG